MSRKKLLIIGGILAFGIIIIVILGITSSKGSADACVNMINTIEQGDTEKSYTMFSPAAQEHTSAADWKTNVNSLKGYFAGKPPVLKSSKQDTNIATGELQTKNIYKISTASGDYIVTCYANSDSLIDIFNSEVDLSKYQN